jgi:hypothetical protein
VGIDRLSTPEPETPQPSHPSAAASAIDWSLLESITHRDPTGRGLASFRLLGQALDSGQLQAAARDLARRAQHVGIVTGFCVAAAGGLTAETDGPPGALYLARALRAIGCRVTVVSDLPALPLLAAGCQALGVPGELLVEFPMRPGAEWIQQFFQSGPGRNLSHLVAIERPGPSHTLDSLLAQSRVGEPPVAAFAAHVGHAERNVCHNMRGESIDERTAPLHLLFEYVERERLPIATVGIGDGGNELGMGRFPWEILSRAVGTPQAALIVSRIATDFVLLAGVSNWAAYALALATIELRGAHEAAIGWHAHCERELIEAIVRDSPAVDGITLQHEATVDGLPLAEYLQPLAEMRRHFGFVDPPMF